MQGNPIFSVIQPPPSKSSNDYVNESDGNNRKCLNSNFEIIILV